MNQSVVKIIRMGALGSIMYVSTALTGMFVATDFESAPYPLGGQYSKLDDTWSRDLDLETGKPFADAAIGHSTAVPARDGSGVLRAYVKFSSPASWPSSGTTHRTEIYMESTNEFGFDRSPDLNSTLYYGYSVYFPQSYIFDTTGSSQWQHGMPMIINQYHHWRGGDSPAIGIEVYKKDICLVHQTNVAPRTEHYVTNIQRGRWMDIVLKVCWAKTGGEIKMWIDGELKLTLANVPTVFSDMDNGGYCKFGIYCWPAMVRDNVLAFNAQGIYDREIFIDCVRILQIDPVSPCGESVAVDSVSPPSVTANLLQPFGTRNPAHNYSVPGGNSVRSNSAGLFTEKLFGIDGRRIFPSNLLSARLVVVPGTSRRGILLRSGEPKP